MVEKGLDTIELKDEESCIRLTRRSAAQLHAGPLAQPAPVASAAAAEAPAPAAAASSPVQTIQTPLAGMFYRASSPTSAPFVKEGDVVDPGQTLCIVEAMKVMNEIKAENRCKITSILVENGRPVTAGQALFEIESA